MQRTTAIFTSSLTNYHGSQTSAQMLADLMLGTESSDSATIHLHGELYTSPPFISAHRELQNMVGEPNCNLPRVVVGLMFWSDATFLTTYGNAKLWPLYMAFGNDSKYQRCKPSSNLYEHVAYFEEVRCPAASTTFQTDSRLIASRTSSRTLRASSLERRS
jgi:hypothetical protein